MYPFLPTIVALTIMVCHAPIAFNISCSYYIVIQIMYFELKLPSISLPTMLNYCCCSSNYEMSLPSFSKHLLVGSTAPPFVALVMLVSFLWSIGCYLLKGRNMVGWTNFGITQSTFLLPKCDSYDHILLYILYLFNGTHYEVMNFNMYIMKLISMKYT